MATLLDLPNELLLRIGDWLGHPPHILQYSRVNQRLHKLSKTLLYIRVSLDYTKYTNPYEDFFKNGQHIRHHDQPPYTTHIRRSSPQVIHQNGQRCPYHGILGLSATLAANADLRPLVRYLNLRILSSASVTDLGLTNLVPHMPCLTELHLMVDGYPGGFHMMLPSTRSAGWSISCVLAAVLSCVSPTLKRFSFFSNDELRVSIGNWANYSALEFLDIQYQLLYGNFERENNQPLKPLFPTKLKELKIRCRPGHSLRDLLRDRSYTEVEAQKSFRAYDSALLQLLDDESPSLDVLRKICICFEDVGNYLRSMSLEEQKALLESYFEESYAAALRHGTDLSFEIVRPITWLGCAKQLAKFRLAGTEQLDKEYER